MKATKTILKSFAILILVFSCGRDLDDDPDFIVTEDPDIIETIDNKLWILKHRRYQDSGIFLYNETTGLLELEFKLPKDLESPHAIAYDGESLWVGGIGEDESIHQINPQTGETLSEIPNIRTEGIAVDEDYIYYSVYETSTINKIEKDGTFVEEILAENASLSIPDIAIDDDNLFYLRYTEAQPIVKLNLSNTNETPISIAGSINTYALTIFNNEIVGVTLLNYISRFNQETGELISTNFTGIEGWITAIAPHYEILETETDIEDEL